MSVFQRSSLHCQPSPPSLLISCCLAIPESPLLKLCFFTSTSKIIPKRTMNVALKEYQSQAGLFDLPSELRQTVIVSQSNCAPCITSKNKDSAYRSHQLVILASSQTCRLAGLRIYRWFELPALVTKGTDNSVSSGRNRTALLVFQGYYLWSPVDPFIIFII